MPGISGYITQDAHNKLNEIKDYYNEMYDKYPMSLRPPKLGKSFTTEDVFERMLDAMYAVIKEDGVVYLGGDNLVKIVYPDHEGSLPLVTFIGPW